MSAENLFRLPYQFAYQIDNGHQHNIPHADFIHLVEIFQTYHSKKRMTEVFEVFNKLDRQELLYRVSAIKKLQALSKHIGLNIRRDIGNAISGASTT